MPAVGSILNSVLSAMHANQLGMSVASNNIANANDLNYTRQRMITAPAADLLGTGSGLGVNVVGVEAVRDSIIERRLRQEDSSKAAADTVLGALADIEGLFRDTEGIGLQKYITDLFSSFQTLSTNASSMSFRELVRTSAQSLADAFKRSSESISRIQTAANQEVSTLAAKINTLTAQIADVTGQIKQSEVFGPANELRDRRSALVRELAAVADVREMETPDNYQVTIGSNRLLVMNTSSFSLTTAPGVAGTTRIFSAGDDITAEITNGRLGGQIELRDKYAPKYLTALDQLAYNIVQQVNTRHAAGYDLDGNTAVDFFVPLTGPSQAARLIALGASVAGNARRIAASTEVSGLGNQNAISIGNLMFEQVSASGSLLDQYRDLVFQVGSDVSSAEVALREHEALSTQLEFRRQALSGVSIDEETVQILQFQRAFEASAQLVRAVDEMLQTILAIRL